MKAFVNIARVIVGCLFIFSGLVKAIDPKGLSYKMQEFFEVWARDGFLPKLMNSFNEHALSFSVIMITLEVLLGVALLLGWYKKIAIWLLLLLTLFFTFLTAFVLFTGKIKACGCFGDCIPLTPTQTFTKDIILLVLVLILLFANQYIKPLFKPIFCIAILVLTIGGTLFLQTYVQHHLPLKDCLPYKVGNNILELRKMPKDAVPDKYDYSFTYQKDGVKKEFTTASLPDSTWQFVDRKQVLVEKGKNNIPLINDFSFTTESGNDTTEAILSQQGEYYLLFVKDFDAISSKWREDKRFISEQHFITKKPIYVITTDFTAANKRYNYQWNSQLEAKIYTNIFICDATAIKTASRSNPTLYLMNGPIVKQKWGSGDIHSVLK
ncbi:MAG: DoxX family membrane protein [Ferruginibacter sp.]|nr:DoxX family membrane protein [Ferruginibacter sp.]